MDTCFVIFQGGSGSKVAQAFSHLGATGSIGTGHKIFVMLCDKDRNNRDTENSLKLITQVEKISIPSFLNPDGNSIHGEKECFLIPFRYYRYNLADDYNKITGINGDNATIKDILCENDNDQKFLDANFSKEQQNMPLTDGFVGSANLGAGAIIRLFKESDEIVKPIKNYIQNNPNENIKVFIVGSAFGGTGASMFLTTAETVKALAPERISVAGELILPSFAFEKRQNCKVNPGSFWGKTMTSLKGYAEAEHLIKSGPADTKGIFDRIYLAAQPNNEQHYCTINVEEGGVGQSRHSDFIDVIGAYYVRDFIMNDTAAAAENISNVFTIQYPEINFDSPYTWDKFNSEIQVCFEHMLVFSAIVFNLKWDLEHIDLTDKHEYKKSWIYKIFGKRRIKAEGAEIKEVSSSVVDCLFDYCSAFVDFVIDLDNNGRDYSGSGFDYSSEYKFFNREAIDKLMNVRDSIAICSKEKIEELLNCENYCCKNVEKTAMSVWNNVNTDITDSGDDIEKTISAYINRLYAEAND